MLVFSKEKFIEDRGLKYYESNKDWIKDCINQEVRFKNKKDEWGRCLKTFYHIHRNWCIEKKD